MENKKIKPELQRSLAQGKTVIGIDIGFSSVNVAQAAFYQGKPVIIKAIVEDIGIVAEQERKKATVNALKKVLANFDTKNADIICTVSNQKTILDYVTMPTMPEAELAQAILIEINNSQQFAVEDPVFDYQVVGRVMDKNVEKTSVMVAVVPKNVIDNLLSYFQPLEKQRLGYLRKVLQVHDFMGLNLVKMIPMSFALENIIKKSTSKVKETIVTLEMGSMFSELNIYRDGHLEFFRKINVTGLDFTRCLTTALSTNMGKVELTLQEAEWVKKEYGIPSASEEFLIKGKITANQTISLLRPKLEQLTREITRSFDFYYDKNRVDKLDRLVLWGGGAMLKRLPEFLNAELGIPVGMGNPLEGVELFDEGVLGHVEDKHRLTLAVGASLSDLKGINLLPDRFRDSNKKFVEKIFIGSVGIGLLLFSFLIYALLQMQLQVTHQESVKLEAEYQALKPNIDDLKNKLLIQNIADHRLDIGGILRELSYLPSTVYLSNLDIEDGSFSMSGVVMAGSKDARKILKDIVLELRKTFLEDIKISDIKNDPDNDQVSSFTITAKLGSEGSGK